MNEDEVKNDSIKKTNWGYPIAYYASFVRLTGSVAAALFLSQALFWTARIPSKRPPGSPGPNWFYKTAEQWEQETGLTRKMQKTARDRLVAKGILSQLRAGIPARMFYRVNIETLNQKIINLYASSDQSRLTEGGKQESDKSTSKHRDRGHTTHRPRQRPPQKPLPLAINVEKGGGEAFFGDIDEYIRLGRRFGGKKGAPPDHPSNWEIAARKRIDKQGSLSRIDKEQLKCWTERESKQHETGDENASYYEGLCDENIEIYKFIKKLHAELP